MTAPLITVKLRGDLGLDDADQLLSELTEETGLEWRSEELPSGDHLSGIVEIMLSTAGNAALAAVVTASVNKVGGKVTQATGRKVREIVDRWKEQRLDPPEATVEVHADEDPAGVGPGEQAS